MQHTEAKLADLPRQGARLVLAAIVAGVCLVGARTSEAHGQVLVTAEQNLQFGMLTPGVPMGVAPTDVGRRATYTIEARGRFNLVFQLPTHLINAHGASIPLLFSPTDGRVEIRQRAATSFDPSAGVSIHINPADQSATIYLGGTANPALGVPAGSYSATIVMMVVQTGT